VSKCAHVFGGARLWNNLSGFSPFCILACTFCVSLATQHFQVNVLQGNALAWHILAATHLDGILGNGCPSNILEDNIANLHCRPLFPAWPSLVAVVLVDDDRVLDIVHDHVLECDVLGISTSSLVCLDACSIGGAM